MSQPHPRAQRIRRHKIDPSPQERLQSLLETHELKQPNRPIELDQNIYVALRASLLARNGAKYGQR